MTTRLFAPAAVASALLLLAAPARAETVEVTAAGLNVRSGPGTRYRVLTTVRRGQRFDVVARSSGWVKMRVGSLQGWSSGNYLRTVSAAPAPTPSAGRAYVVTAATLNVRSGPGTGYRILGTVRRDQRITVTGSSGAWLRTPFQGRDGWVHGNYARPAGSVAPPPAAPAPPTVPTGRPASRAGFIQLRASGPGFYAYASGSRRWGKPALVYGLERAAARWSQTRGVPRIGVGDISRENGGVFLPHVSHRLGVDADIRPMRTSGEGPVSVGQAAYSRSRTRAVIDLIRAQVNERLILFNDRGIPGVQSYPGHSNHFHVRIR